MTPIYWISGTPSNHYIYHTQATSSPTAISFIDNTATSTAAIYQQQILQYATQLQAVKGGILNGSPCNSPNVPGYIANTHYKGAPRDFNRYINASDLLEEFIGFAKAQGARKKDILELPLQLFIMFLVIRAAEADGEAPPAGVVVELPAPKFDRCGYCGRFMKPARVAKGITHCSVDHFDRHMRRLEAA